MRREQRIDRGPCVTEQDNRSRVLRAPAAPGKTTEGVVAPMALVESRCGIGEAWISTERLGGGTPGIRALERPGRLHKSMTAGEHQVATIAAIPCSEDSASSKDLGVLWRSPFYF